jgi:hypothetical protein
MPGPLRADQQYTFHITAPQKRMSIQYTKSMPLAPKTSFREQPITLIFLQRFVERAVRAGSTSAWGPVSGIMHIAGLACWAAI